MVMQTTRPQILTDELEQCNAIINSVVLSTEHGLFFSMGLDYDGLAQHFARPIADKDSSYAAEFLMRTMKVVGVSELSQLVGKAIRVRRTHDSVEAIGNIIKEDWFSPKELWEELQARKSA